ncbi:MAG TPA: ABC transporter ATP-binding protein [Chthoniobacterales bacterium]
MSVYARTVRYFIPFWWQTLVGALLILATTAFSLLKPWPFKYLIDGVLTVENTPAARQSREFLARWIPDSAPLQIVFWLCGALILINFLAGLLNLASNFLLLRTGLVALMKLRTDLYAYLQSLPLKFHDSRRTTDSAFRVAYDSQSIQTLYNKGFATIFSSVVMLIGTFVVMYFMNWQLTLASLVVLPAVVFAVRYFAVRIRNQSTTIQERESDLLTVVQEGLSAIRMVHAFGREDFEVRQFRKRAVKSLEANLQLNLTSVVSALVVATLMAGGTALLYYIGSKQVLEGNLTLGDLTVFATYLVMLYQPLEQITYTVWAVEGATAGARRCFEVLDRANDVPEMPHAKKLPAAKGEIRFENIQFSYDGSRRILQDINLTIPAGQKVAVVGGTGEGKSTLLSLVPRFYDPDGGTIYLDGHDLRTLTKKSLREQISIVLQDTLLFSTTIRENIAYGRALATEEEILEAARKAQALDFIQKLPDGLGSQVGERGSQLSVGQRQRIGIARAFLKNAPILLLDEPTSALDPTTEHSIMDAIFELMEGRTTMIVTHRLATIHQIPRIVVLKNGRVAEDGAGPELVAKGGIYAGLYRSGQYAAG